MYRHALHHLGLGFCLLTPLIFSCSSEKEGPAPSKSDTSQAAAPALESVSVALNWYPEPEFGGLYAAVAHGYYENMGLKVDLIPGGPGAPVIPRVATGDVEFGVVTADLVVGARAAGALVKSIFATFQIHPQGIMVHKAKGYQGLRDIKGGTMALEVGPPFATWLRKKYAFEGVKYVPYDGSTSRFLVDEDYAQQVYVTSEPYLAQSQGAKTQVFLVADTGYNPYANILIASDKTLKGRSKMVSAFITATAKGWETYFEAPEKANAIIQKGNPAMTDGALKFSSDAQKPLIRGTGNPPPALGYSSPERWAQLTEQLIEMGELDKDMDPKTLYTNDYLPPATP